MAIVVTGTCRDCRFTECVDVCPVSCIHLGETMVYINPDTCIECRACVPVCPVSAIYDIDDLPAELEHWVEENRVQSKVLPSIPRKLPPLPTADERRAQILGAA